MLSLSRRERQIMDAVHRLGQATAAEVRDALPDPPGYSSVRTLLRILEEKGHLTHDEDGQRYVYRPTQPRATAERSAVEHLLTTFFDGQPGRAVAALLDVGRDELSDADLDRLARLISQAREEGR